MFRKALQVDFFWFDLNIQKYFYYFQQPGTSSQAKAQREPEPPQQPEDMSHPEKMNYIHNLLHSQGLSFHMLKDQRSVCMLQHFCDVMSSGIRKLIEFCKGIPEFQELGLNDQVVLLRGGCLEMLVVRSYFAFSVRGDSYVSSKFKYDPSDFITAGASEEFIRAYNDVHCRMRKIKIKVTEICLLLALILFSPDRKDLQARQQVEKIQVFAAETLQTLEFMDKPAELAVADFGEIMLILPKLRSISTLFSKDIKLLQQDFDDDMNPLIFEVNSQK